jgi:hypothetical protein
MPNSPRPSSAEQLHQFLLEEMKDVASSLWIYSVGAASVSSKVGGPQ